MKVGYVLARFPTTSETFIAGEITALTQQGVEVEVYAMARADPDETRHPEGAALEKNARFFGTSYPMMFRGALKALTRPSGWRALWRAIAMSIAARRIFHLRLFGPASHLATIVSPDVDRLHAHFAYVPTAIACLTSTILSIPYSFTAHAHDIQRTEGAGDLRVFARHAAAMVVVSSSGRERLASQIAPRDRARIHVVRNGIDLGAFALDRKREGDLIVAVARLVELKGIDTLLHAVALLNREGLSLRLELVGSGPEEMRLRKLAWELRIHDATVFHGAQDAVIVRGILPRAAVFVLPSRVAADGKGDTLPVAITEAMAAGVPVVSTRLAGIPEVVQDGVTGLLVDPNDPEALATAIRRVVTDEVLADNFSRAGRALVESEYDRKLTAHSLIGLWKTP